MMAAPSLQAFQARLDVALGSLGCWLATLHIAGGWNQIVIVVLFNPGHPMILWVPMDLVCVLLWGICVSLWGICVSLCVSW